MEEEGGRWEKKEEGVDLGVGRVKVDLNVSAGERWEGGVVHILRYGWRGGMARKRASERDTLVLLSLPLG